MPPPIRPTVDVRTALTAYLSAPPRALDARDAAIAYANATYAEADRNAIAALDAWLASTIAAASAPTGTPYVINPALALDMAEVPALFAGLASPPDPRAWWVALTTAHASTRASLNPPAPPAPPVTP